VPVARHRARRGLVDDNATVWLGEMPWHRARMRTGHLVIVVIGRPLSLGDLVLPSLPLQRLKRAGFA